MLGCQKVGVAAFSQLRWFCSVTRIEERSKAPCRSQPCFSGTKPAQLETHCNTEFLPARGNAGLVAAESAVFSRRWGLARESTGPAKSGRPLKSAQFHVDH
jgi:hypothetical protein